MNLAILGTGYVGLVTGACLAESGNHVVCIDADKAKVAQLETGAIPFYEPGLDVLLHKLSGTGMLEFSGNIERAHNADIVFLAIGTPAGKDGSPDLSNIMDCVRRLALVVKRPSVVVVKSTVPVGTGERIQAIFDSGSSAGRMGSVAVASNPEFLAEGHALQDFRSPRRIVVGTADERAARLLRRLYAPFDPDGGRLLFMDLRSAEFAKYACNAMLASRVSMVNELSDIAGRLKADIHSVCGVMRTDPRIGSTYLQPGIGYGGSCLPKDLRALIGMARDHDEPADMLRSAQRVNERQRQLLSNAIHEYFAGALNRSCIAVWGLAFKPGTDDVRAAPSLDLIQDLLAAGAQVRAYDPVASESVRAMIDDPALTLTTTAVAACEGADALAVMTEWEEFKHPDFAMLASQLKAAAIFDGRYLYDGRDLSKHHLAHYQPGCAFTVGHGVRPLESGTPIAVNDPLTSTYRSLRGGL